MQECIPGPRERGGHPGSFPPHALRGRKSSRLWRQGRETEEKGEGRGMKERGEGRGMKVREEGRGMKERGEGRGMGEKAEGREIEEC